MLKRYFVEDDTFIEVDSVACASIKFTLLDYEYVSNDRGGHYVVDGNIFERNNSYCEKVGDVLFYLKTYFGNTRLLNRHNCEKGEEVIKTTSVRKAFVAHACLIHDDGVQSRCREGFSLLSKKDSIAVGGSGS